MHTRDRARLACAALLGLVVPLAACDQNAPTTHVDAGAADAGPPQPVLDKELSAAVAAASAAAASAAPKATDGPPESGVFPTGAADALHRKGEPAKVEVLDQGKEPRATFASPLDAAAEQNVVVSVAMRLGPQSAMPTIDFGLDLKIEKPKDADKGKKGGDQAAAPATRAAVAKVTSAALSSKQPGKVPREVADQLGKLKGSVIRFQLEPSGAGSGYAVELAKGAEPALEPALDALAEAVSVVTVPMPGKPVGAGGYWMVTDRATSLGIDVLRYRVFRVEKVEAGAPTLAFDVRQYAAEGTASIPLTGETTQLTVAVFQSQGKGHVALESKPSIVATRAQLSLQTGAGVSNGTAQGAPQRGVQTDLTVDLVPSSGK